MKLKKLMAAVLSFSIVCGAVPFNNAFINASAVYAEEDAEYTEGTYGPLSYTNYGDYIEISRCEPYAIEVEIPSEIDGVPVTTIGDGAFYGEQTSGIGAVGKMQLTSITIPDSIVKIDAYAFTGCLYLTSITIPDSVISIGVAAFADCPSLTNVTIPDHHISVEENTFSDTPWLENQRSKNPLVIVNNMVIDGVTCEGDITIPNGVTSIWGGAFESNDGLTSITIPDSVTIIDNYAFTNCESLESVIVPSSVSYIGWGAFFGKNINNITILNPDCELVSIISNDDLSITGYDNSTAQALAEIWDLEFISLGEYVETLLGDPDGDGVITASDASTVLAEYAKIATGSETTFSEIQTAAADVNNDGAVDSSDASSILAYYAFVSTGGEGTLAEFLSK